MKELKQSIELSNGTLEDIATRVQSYFDILPIDEQNKSIIADTAYYYLGVNPAFTLGELYLKLGINKSFLKTDAIL